MASVTVSMTIGVGSGSGSGTVLISESGSSGEIGAGKFIQSDFILMPPKEYMLSLSASPNKPNAGYNLLYSNVKLEPDSLPNESLAPELVVQLSPST